MLFNSLQFLIFLPIVFILYYLTPKKYKLFLLFLASCIFYLAGTPVYIAVIFLTIVIDFFAAKLIAAAKRKRRKYYLLASLVSNIGLLAFFKYANFVSKNVVFAANLFGLHLPPLLFTIAIPIGLSFHTFQGMSYVIEVYKKRYAPEKNLLRYGLYVMFFPQLVAGPIERPQQLLQQLRKVPAFSYLSARNGLRLMLWGMVKKVAVADRIAVFTDPVFQNPHNSGSITLIVATVLFAFQIYYDFSGYTDIARGVANLFGYNLEPNFNNPYISDSVQAFWRRWHMSLSFWFRDYLYIPLGGSRKGNLRTACNILITFFLCGLWHGASWTYVVWGGLHGIYLALYHLKKSARALNAFVLPKYFAIPSTFILICVGWIFFRAKTLSDAMYMLQTIFTRYPFHGHLTQEVFLNQNAYEFFIVIFLIIFIELLQIFRQRAVSIFNTQPVVLRWASYALLLWIIILAGKFGQRPFIYFAF